MEVKEVDGGGGGGGGWEEENLVVDEGVKRDTPGSACVCYQVLRGTLYQLIAFQNALFHVFYTVKSTTYSSSRYSVL